MKSAVTWALSAFLFLGVWACHAEENDVAIMTYNIRHGVGMDGILDLSRTASAIRSLNPDILILNEVDEGTKRSSFVRQADRLGKLLGLQSRFGRSIDYDGGKYGNAFLTIYPILSFEVLDLSADASLEGRSAFLAQLLVGDDTLVVMGTHLGLKEEEQLLQVKKIVSDLPRTGKLILAGDLNFTPETDQYDFLADKLLDGVKEIGRDVDTFPADDPNRRIDYIFLGNDLDPIKNLAVKDTWMRMASDHLPQLLIVRIK